MGFLFTGTGEPQGLLIGKVLNNYDKDHAGMVQVSLHACKDTKGTLEWARVLSPAAGDKCGIYFLPAVGDEVLVGFIDNDLSYPVVLGGLWNADSYPAESVTEDNNIKRIRLKSGMDILLDEKQDKELLRLTTPKGMTITLADETETVTITAKDDGNSIVIDAKNKAVTVKSADKLTLEGKAVVVKGADSIKLESKAITLEASNQLIMEGKSKLAASGGQMELTGKSKLAASGAQAEIKASATLKLEGSAMAELKGGLVKING